jgi:hypothetical protein
MNPTIISRRTARRFVLGRQGLWPGRRWKGKHGTAAALRVCEAVQLDPLNVTGRSQDLVLHSRVLDYKPEYLQQVLYKDREFFDYGGWLAVYPMSELPYWRYHMEKRSHDKRVEDFVFTHPAIFDRVRDELRKRGPLGNRDVDGNAVRWNYRGRKDTSLALFDMWLSGELMIHHRERFDRFYDFRENIAPTKFDYAAGEKQAEEFFARKCIAFKGLMPVVRWKTDLEYYVHHKIERADMKNLAGLWMEQGLVAPIRIDGKSEKYLVLGEDLPLIESLESGKAPKAWKPIESTTLDEVSLLSPLDIVSARGRAKKLFDFEYLWEVYKPLPQRRWGYYVLPILYGDDLVARIDPKLDRVNMSLQINGFWLEEDAPGNDASFSKALARGLIHFANFLEAKRIDITAIRPLKLRREIRLAIAQLSEMVVK